MTTFARSVSRRYCEPVTVVAAPRKWRWVGILGSPLAQRRRDDRVDRDGEEQQRQVADRVAVEADRAGSGLRLGGARPPQRDGLPQEHGAEDDRRDEIDPAQASDGEQDEA